jgi:hypothetical protein
MTQRKRLNWRKKPFSSMADLGGPIMLWLELIWSKAKMTKPLPLPREPLTCNRVTLMHTRIMGFT